MEVADERTELGDWDEWTDYGFDPEQLIRDQAWEMLSLQYVSEETTDTYQEQLNWTTIANNWPLTDTICRRYAGYLVPHYETLRLRAQLGFIQVSEDVLSGLCASSQFHV